MTKKLKQCPFCGEKAKFAKSGADNWVFCSNCGAEQDSCKTEEEADYVQGETKSQNQSLDLFFDGKNIEVCSEFMDRIDKKVAIRCIRSVLDLYEKKEELK